ncbi:class A beta-lactamase-related serine hydrolase [Streptomyces sp. RKND-216]|uniref:serine hydrolase domain-containing protein n=1 Tax=Streptomyces sp. RKND-216 TaxID=2562581 RepID=UPI00109DAC7C|nr:serine hydrolase domain-containing protein [Streptomyces sp. RKND-216]THA26400.1 class A beta-lactamase-related serine hydrolase [Streptomyces sp. RKND-216]
MSLRTAVALVLAAAAVVVVSVHSSTAADLRHAPTREAMADLVERERVPGVLARAEDDGEVWHDAAGVADRTTGRERRPADRFRIGSITKTFVATVLLQLEAEGRLDLDDPVAVHLPGVVRGHGNDGRRVTVRRLLNHTSGIHDFTHDPAFRDRYLGDRFLDHRFDTRTARELVRIAMRYPPAFRPGARWAYSNTNYVLAGMVVEAVTGSSYARQIEQRVLVPLGLRHTTLPGTAATLPRPHGRAYSTFYRGRPDEGRGRPVRDVTALDPSVAGASGEMISTAGDLLTFFRALLGGRLLPAEQLAQMTDTVPTSGSLQGRSDRYGLGIRARELPCGTTVWGHAGDIHGSLSTVAATRDGGHATAFNLNADWAPHGTGALLEAEFCADGS